MFKVVASFTRPNTDYEFLSDIYMDNEAIVELHKNAGKIPGYLGIDENIYRDDFRCDKAMCFENIQAFYQFVTENKELLDRRSDLIAEYCARTQHEYKYYYIEI